MNDIPLIKITDVIKLTTLSRSTIYDRVAKGEFPNRIQLSPRRVAWRRVDIENWIANQAA